MELTNEAEVQVASNATKSKKQKKASVQVNNKISAKQTSIVNVNCPTKSGCKRKKRKTSPVCRKRNKAIRTRLIQISRCVPINQKCDGVTNQAYFFTPVRDSSMIGYPSGTVTIVNSSPECTMRATITSVDGSQSRTIIDPLSSFTGTIPNLNKVDLLCSGNKPSAFCTGTLQIDLHYTVKY
ncbi:S-Ena type endospore appendage [Paenibacillus sp. YYML68]|uniref:S-Ena type endospore appendage n=1 Tax=Paenibacillus sp. YYML68 TaxID=2909250 RepID=UPI00248FF028|nr:S-Ena type endospore appendage [Paenibacillus sp. YYML68]